MAAVVAEKNRAVRKEELEDASLGRMEDLAEAQRLWRGRRGCKSVGRIVRKLRGGKIVSGGALLVSNEKREIVETVDIMGRFVRITCISCTSSLNQSWSSR
jgi:ribosomal protein S27E